MDVLEQVVVGGEEPLVEEVVVLDARKCLHSHGNGIGRDTRHPGSGRMPRDQTRPLSAVSIHTNRPKEGILAVCLQAECCCARMKDHRKGRDRDQPPPVTLRVPLGRTRANLSSSPWLTRAWFRTRYDVRISQSVHRRAAAICATPHAGRPKACAVSLLLTCKQALCQTALGPDTASKHPMLSMEDLLTPDVLQSAGTGSACRLPPAYQGCCRP